MYRFIFAGGAGTLPSAWGAAGAWATFSVLQVWGSPLTAPFHPLGGTPIPFLRWNSWCLEVGTILLHLHLSRQAQADLISHLTYLLYVALKHAAGLPKKLLFGEVKGLRPPGRPRSVSMMLHYVIVNTVVLVGLTGMHKTGCSGKTRLVLHIPSSS